MMTAMNENREEFLYVEKYRPRTIEDCILPAGLTKTFKEIVKSGEIPNMLFSGTAGVGKTTVAKALCNELDLDYLMINGSEEGNIDTLRGRIKQFASTVSLHGGYKVVILDECLDQEEAVRVGTVDDWTPVALKDFEVGKQYPIVSYNMDSGEFENDIGEIISDKDDMVYEVTMDNGKTIRVTDNHPFIVQEDETGDVVEMSIRDGLLADDIAVILADGLVCRIDTIKKVGIRRVRNLVVHGNHTFVTENGIVTHNCDYLPAHSTQPALRGFIEEFSKNCRFILTANFKNRIIEPLHSRCSVYEFNIPNKEKPKIAARFFKRLTDILDNEGITYDPKALVPLIEKHFPDWRRVINECQRYSISGQIDVGILSNLSDESTKTLMKALKEKDFGKMRRWVVENMDVEAASIFRRIYDTMVEYVQPQSIPQVVLILAQYQYWDSHVADHELNVVACMTELMASVEWK